MVGSIGRQKGARGLFQTPRRKSAALEAMGHAGDAADAASYIAQSASELMRLAKGADLPFVAYLLSLVLAEANSTLRQTGRDDLWAP